MKLVTRKAYRERRHRRVRRKISGTNARPRMALMRSNRQMYVQFIDDEQGVTLASASTTGAQGPCNVEAAKSLGKAAADAALAKGIRCVVVDRGGFKFHGRIKAIVDGALEGGLTTRTVKSGDEEAVEAVEAEDAASTASAEKEES